MAYQEATDVSRSLSKTQIADEVSNVIPTKLILRFVVLIYDGTSANTDANAAARKHPSNLIAGEDVFS